MKTKTQIIGDLLASALSQFTEGLSNEPTEDEVGKDSRIDYCGQRGWYEQLLQKHLAELEQERESD